MGPTSSRVEVGVRDLKNNLRRYLDGVGKGTEVIVTDRGRPVARLVRIDASTDRLADLTDTGVVRRAPARSRHIPRRIETSEPVSDMVAEQRR